MGKKLSCCNNTEGATMDQMVFVKQSLLPFQNYTQNVSQLDRYDRFYRVVCYPLHCLKSTEFFMELDALQRICDITVGTRSPDSDQVPLHKFYEYYFEGIALWANLIQQRECVFKKLVQLSGLFVPRMGGGEINDLLFTAGRRQSAASPSPCPLRRHQSIGGPNYSETTGNDSMVAGAGNLPQLKRSASIEMQVNVVDSPFDEEERLGLACSPLESFLRMPELNVMFSQRLEPSFIRTDKGIMRRDGITISMEP